MRILLKILARAGTCGWLDPLKRTGLSLQVKAKLERKV
jgi:hypothetical protein